MGNDEAQIAPGTTPSQANSANREFIKEGVQRSDSFVFEDRNVRTRDNRRGSGRSEPPPRTAKIVIDLRRRYRAKHRIREHP